MIKFSCVKKNFIIIFIIDLQQVYNSKTIIVITKIHITKCVYKAIKKKY